MILLEIMIFLIWYINKRIYNIGTNVVNPVNCFLAVWGVLILLHRLYFGINEYTTTLYICIGVGIVSFVVFFWISCKVEIVIGRKNDRLSQSQREFDYEFLRKFLLLMTIAEILRLAYYTYTVYKLAGGSITLFLSDNTYVRNLYLRRNEGTFWAIISEFLLLNTMIGTVILGKYVMHKNKKWFFYLSFWTICEFALTIVTMSKMSFVIYLIALALSMIYNAGSERLQRKTIQRILPLAIILVVGLSLLIGIQRNYAYYSNSLAEGVFSRGSLYFVGPIEALGKRMITIGSPLELGENTFKFIYRILYRFGLTSTSELYQHGTGNIAIKGGEVNVFTWFLAFYNDFSYFGYLIGPAIMGALYGILYKTQNNSLFYEISYVWLTTVLMMSFYSYMFTQSVYLLIVPFAFLTERLFSDKIYKPSESMISSGDR